MNNSLPNEDSSNVLGWHDSHCASAVLLRGDGSIAYALAEERLNGKKLYKGYPSGAIEDIKLKFGGIPEQIAYADLPLGQKITRNLGCLWNAKSKGLNCEKPLMGMATKLFEIFGKGQFSGVVGTDKEATETIGFNTLSEHHTAHAMSAYYFCEQDEAYVVTVDGVGDCLSGSVSHGVNGKLTRLHHFYYNDLTVGADYETFTGMMGFNPDRHCGKITGLAAYGKYDEACISALKEFFADSWKRGNRNYFDRMHGAEEESTINALHALRKDRFGQFSREDLSFAIQYLSEVRVLELIREHVPNIRGSNIALAGGVFANVRINQKVKELGFKNIFVQPAMDDGGLALGAALVHLTKTKNLRPMRLPNVFLGT